MKEIVRLKAQDHSNRTQLVQALNELGYATRVDRVEEPSEIVPIYYSKTFDYYVVVYDTEIKAKP